MKAAGANVMLVPGADVLTGLGKLSVETITAIADQDPLSRKVSDSIMAVRKDALNWSSCRSWPIRKPAR